MGLPFNIASYAVLSEIIAIATDYPSLGIEGGLKCVHLYDNQILPSREISARDYHSIKPCKLVISDKAKEAIKILDFNSIEPADFKLEGYEPLDKVLVAMLAPKEI